MPSNPFSALERQNFPEFSPVFTKTRTPSSAERNGSFHWSIDHIARLKPADIDTDPATLVKTNGHSFYGERCYEIRLYLLFVQSLWNWDSPEDDNEAQEAVDTFFSQCTILPSPWTTGRKTVAKRVTFSPLPPTMAFIREDTFVESEQRPSDTADSGTQTVLTFPVSCDLEKLLAGATSCFSEDDNNRDLSSSTLRRKLFGKPDRQGWNTDSEEVMEVDGSSPSPPPVPDAIATPKTPLSKKGCGPPSTPLHPSQLDSPAIILTFRHGRSEEEGDNPAMSSMILQVPSKDLPEFSPIRGSEGQDPSNIGEGDSGKVCSKNLFPATPCKTAERKTRDEDVNIPVSPILSPIRGRGAILSPANPDPMVGGIRPMSSGKTTSTPNTAVMKRQLAASPFASPVLKQPCTARLDMEDCSSNSDSSETEDLAQPLSLGDLRTETYDLTSITATTCSSYFTQIGLEGGESRHPLHSTATISNWHPPVHSTMVESQKALASNTATNLPTIREISQIPSSTSAADSGVAALTETNTTSTVNLSSSSKFDSNELGITRSSGNPVLLQANNDELHVPSRPDVSNETTKSQTQNGAQGYKAREKWSNSRMLTTTHAKIRHPDLPTIQESEAQMETPTEKSAAAVNVPCESDSGLVPSPDTYSRHATDQHKLNTNLTIAHAPARGVLISASPHLIGSKLQGPALLQTAKYNSDGTNVYGGATHTHTSPSLQCTPSRYNTLRSEALVHQMRFTTKSVFPSSVLPSRLKLSTTPQSTQFPSVYPQPRTTTNCFHQYDTAASTFGVCGGSHLHSVYHTPPSRYSGFRSDPGSLGSKASFAGFTREVLRRKESLKSRLQFSSPIKSTSPFNSPISSHLNLPISGAMATGSCVPVTRRTPLTEVGLNRPKSPMNCCCSQFGPSSPLSPNFHGNQLPGRPFCDQYT